MILRSWRGWTTVEDADRYVDYLRETGIRDYRATPGNCGVYILRREVGDRAEFLLLSLWHSMDAVKAFAGDEPARAVFYPRDSTYLVDKDDHVDHYEVIEGIAPDLEGQIDRR